MYDRIMALKYVGICILMMVFPSESIMPIAGHLAATNDMSLLGVIASGTAGSTFGSAVIYTVSRVVGQDTVVAFIVRRGKWLGVTGRSTERAGRWFDRHAGMTVFFGRFVPGVRTAVSIPAGIRRMPFMTFIAYTAAGSGIWITFITLLGYFARTEYMRIQQTANYTTLVVEVALVIVLIGLVVYRRRRKG